MKQKIQFDELSRQARVPGFRLDVKSFSPVWGGLFMGLIGALVVFVGVSHDQTSPVVLGVLALGYGVFALLYALPVFGRPAISLDAIGFSTPYTPHIRWQQVEGIYLEEVRSRGRSVAHYLYFRVDSLEQHAPQFQFVYRLLYAMRSRAAKETIRITLKYSSVDPDDLYRLSRMLWRTATGRIHEWNPHMSTGVNAAMRRADEAEAVMKDLAGNPLFQSPGGIENLGRKLEQDRQIVVSGYRRKAWQWIALTVVGLVAWMIALYLKHRH